MASFRELEVWKQARKIRMLIADLVKDFPAAEKFRLTDQLIRCSRSIENNIAEGHGRYHYMDNVKFCLIARGSLSETLDHLIVAVDENYISETTLNLFEAEYDQCLRLLNGYIQYIKRKKINEVTS